MIKNIFELLSLDTHYGQSEIIEIAKGKYKLVTSWKQGFEQLKRQWKIK